MVCLNPYSLNSLRGLASWTPLHSEKKTSPTWIAKTAKTSGSEMNPFGSFSPQDPWDCSFTYVWLIFMVNVLNIPYMDPMGLVVNKD